METIGNFVVLKFKGLCTADPGSNSAYNFAFSKFKGAISCLGFRDVQGMFF